MPKFKMPKEYLTVFINIDAKQVMNNLCNVVVTLDGRTIEIKAILFFIQIHIPNWTITKCCVHHVRGNETCVSTF